MLPEMAKRSFKPQIFGTVSGGLLGGTGKAELAKLPGAGIGPEQSQKMSQGKGHLPDSVRIAVRSWGKREFEELLKRDREKFDRRRKR
jgi:hypothetical protein